MAEKPENLLLEYMRRFDARRPCMATWRVTPRGEIETIKSRLDRIERRLDLADAPA